MRDLALLERVFSGIPKLGFLKSLPPHVADGWLSVAVAAAPTISLVRGWRGSFVMLPSHHGFISSPKYFWENYESSHLKAERKLRQMRGL